MKYKLEASEKMTINQLYLPIMFAGASCLLITGLTLLFIKAPADGRAAKYRKAKSALTASVIILGLLNIVQITYDSRGTDPHLGSCMALAVSYWQAMLFTMALLVLIRPEVVTRKSILTQIAIYLALDVILLCSYLLLPIQSYLYVYELGIILYLLQLVNYVRWFRKSRMIFFSKIKSYYEEEEIERSLQWILYIFRMALVVALFSLLMVFHNRIIDMILTASLALFYALFAACFVNYGLTAPLILPAINTDEKSAERETAEEENGHAEISKLESWIKKKGYLNNEMAVADIAAQMDMSIEQFNRYFRDEVGEEFRTWRVRLRIEESKRLMAQHPELSTTQIGKMSGFNDRSFFYQQFLRFTGTSVAEYRKNM